MRNKRVEGKKENESDTRIERYDCCSPVSPFSRASRIIRGKESGLNFVHQSESRDKEKAGRSSKQSYLKGSDCNPTRISENWRRESERCWKWDYEGREKRDIFNRTTRDRKRDRRRKWSETRSLLSHFTCRVQWEIQRNNWDRHFGPTTGVPPSSHADSFSSFVRCCGTHMLPGQMRGCLGTDSRRW